MSLDRAGRSPLHYAALEDDITTAETLLAAGEDPGSADNQGFTPLHLAAQEYSLNVALLLLQHHAPVDQPNRFGNTALFTAVFNSRGRGGLIELLRRHDADPLKTNANGQTPLGLARKIADHDIAQFFADLP
jgi:ankyrin repeat protein